MATGRRAGPDSALSNVERVTPSSPAAVDHRFGLLLVDVVPVGLDDGVPAVRQELGDLVLQVPQDLLVRRDPPARRALLSSSSPLASYRRGVAWCSVRSKVEGRRSDEAEKASPALRPLGSCRSDRGDVYPRTRTSAAMTKNTVSVEWTAIPIQALRNRLDGRA